jgi:hypothetical protein
MFDAPPSTLCASLEKLLENPKEYLADITFHFPSGDIHAHRGRTSYSFTKAMANLQK